MKIIWENHLSILFSFNPLESFSNYHNASKQMLNGSILTMNVALSSPIIGPFRQTNTEKESKSFAVQILFLHIFVYWQKRNWKLFSFCKLIWSSWPMHWVFFDNLQLKIKNVRSKMIDSFSMILLIQKILKQIISSTGKTSTFQMKIKTANLNISVREKIMHRRIITHLKVLFSYWKMLIYNMQITSKKQL